MNKFIIESIKSIARALFGIGIAITTTGFIIQEPIITMMGSFMIGFCATIGWMSE